MYFLLVFYNCDFFSCDFISCDFFSVTFFRDFFSCDFFSVHQCAKEVQRKTVKMQYKQKYLYTHNVMMSQAQTYRCNVSLGNLLSRSLLEDVIEPSHEKTNIVVSDQVRHKSDCTATEDG